jgi:hypothetical protein
MKEKNQNRTRTRTEQEEKEKEDTKKRVRQSMTFSWIEWQHHEWSCQLKPKMEMYIDKHRFPNIPNTNQVNELEKQQQYTKQSINQIVGTFEKRKRKLVRTVPVFSKVRSL